MHPDMSFEQQYKEGTDERQTKGHGGFTPGSPILSGGVRKAGECPMALELNHGTVLSTSSTLQPNMAVEGALKPGTTERLGLKGGFTSSPARNMETKRAPELNHGTILSTCAVMPDQSYEAAVETLKPGTDERQNHQHGGFLPGKPILALCSPPSGKELDHGTVLAVSDNLKPNMAVEGQVKLGTTDERLGVKGGFTASPMRNRETKRAPELDHGTVLSICDLKVDQSYENAIETIKPNTIDERQSHTHGGFVSGRVIRAGGVAK